MCENVVSAGGSSRCCQDFVEKILSWEKGVLEKPMVVSAAFLAIFGTLTGGWRAGNSGVFAQNRKFVQMFGVFPWRFLKTGNRGISKKWHLLGNKWRLFGNKWRLFSGSWLPVFGQSFETAECQRIASKAHFSRISGRGAASWEKRRFSSAVCQEK